MVKTILAVLIAAVPAGAAEFGLETAGLAGLREMPVIEASAPLQDKGATQAALAAGSISRIGLAAQRLRGLSSYIEAQPAAPKAYSEAVSRSSERVSEEALDMQADFRAGNMLGVLEMARALDREVYALRKAASGVAENPAFEEVKGPELGRLALDLENSLALLRYAAAGLADKASRLSVGEIENRWIAAIFVAGRNLDSIASSAQGVSPHAAPAGYAVSLSILADRTAGAAEAMHYAWLDRRWHIVASEANKLDRVAADLREWAAEAKAHHNAAALRAGDLARAAADLSSALQWLRADSPQLRKSPQPAIMPLYEFGLDCRGENVNLAGRLSRKGGQVRVASAPLYQQQGGEGETLRFLPEAGYPGDSLVFLSADSAFFDLALELPASALTNPGAFAAELRISFNDETQARTALTCATKLQ